MQQQQRRKMPAGILNEPAPSRPATTGGEIWQQMVKY
jgi:hypothetical protein